MKIFSCSVCQNVVFFENSQCTRCLHLLSYLPDRGVLSAIEISAEDPQKIVVLDPAAQGARYRLCANYTSHAVCNWAIREDDPNDFCLACRLNHTIPDLSAPNAVEAWHHMEIAKRRLVYTLIGLGLPVESKEGEANTGLAFAFKRDEADGTRVLTGHCDGLVTINVREADPAERERTRLELGETYRTLLGHFRHESGHYYWERLVSNSAWLSQYRALFGDETLDYESAVQRHYQAGPPPNWPENYVSAYATMHPWEDWAETWAHYLHMVDTLETARSYGIALKPVAVGGAPAENVSMRRLNFDDFTDLITAWLPLTVALNSFNRGMGLNDLYPFVLTDRVIEKLRFVHEVIEGDPIPATTDAEPRASAAPLEQVAPPAPASLEQVAPPAQASAAEPAATAP